MDRNSMITSVVAAVAIATAVLGGVQGCTSNAKQNTLEDSKRFAECVKAGGSWVNGYSGNQCVVTKGQ